MLAQRAYLPERGEPPRSGGRRCLGYVAPIGKRPAMAFAGYLQVGARSGTLRKCHALVSTAGTSMMLAQRAYLPERGEPPRSGGRRCLGYVAPIGKRPAMAFAGYLQVGARSGKGRISYPAARCNEKCRGTHCRVSVSVSGRLGGASRPSRCSPCESCRPPLAPS